MEINVHRKWFTPKSTIGEMYYAPPGGSMVLQHYVLEDMVRPKGIKIQGKTAIPTGKYRLVLSWSWRFKTIMPELLDVPNFSGVRIHVGNREEDSDGCLLLGDTIGVDFVGSSKDAYSKFCDRVCRAIREKEDVFVTIHGEPDPRIQPLEPRMG
jgi:hypothetical protein